jgi:hypothetical protein
MGVEHLHKLEMDAANQQKQNQCRELMLLDKLREFWVFVLVILPLVLPIYYNRPAPHNNGRPKLWQLF